MSTNYNPPAADIEREARKLRMAEYPNTPSPWGALTEREHAPYLRGATHVLRVRHEREAPLVEAVKKAQREAYTACHTGIWSTLNDALAAHAALDRESEPTLAEAVDAMLKAFDKGYIASGAHLDALRAALARERGK